MAVTTTLQTILRRTIRGLDICWVGMLADETTAATAVVAGSVTVPSLFHNTNYGPAFLSSQNVAIWRLGAASVADYERYAGALTNTTGLVVHTGANYADTTLGTEVFYFVKYGPRIADFIAALNRTMQKIYFPTRIALSLLSNLDGDMVVSTDSNWTDVDTPTTSAKSTTARRTPYGVRSYNLINNAVNEGTRSATMPVITGRRVKAFTIASTNVGTSSFRLRDVTGVTAADTAAVVTSEE